MKTLECSRCHRLFRSTDERIYIHTKDEDFNWCESCTKRALQLMGQNLKDEETIRLNYECLSCPVKQGCLTLCATNPEDVMQPPCGKYAIGITGNRNDSFWTRPSDAWLHDRFNSNPQDLRFVIVENADDTEVSVI